MDLGPLLSAHGYLRVERPPELWEADVDDVLLVRALGEMIVAAVGRGTALGDVVLRANNVTVEPSGPSAVEEGPEMPAPGEYVALSILGRGDWRPEIRWWPGAGAAATLVSAALDSAAAAAGIPFAYTRSTGDGGSVTLFLHRAASRARE